MLLVMVYREGGGEFLKFFLTPRIEKNGFHGISFAGVRFRLRIAEVLRCVWKFEELCGL
jgi:hypothetical protein